MPWIADEPLPVDQRISMIEGWNAGWRQGGDSVLGILSDDEIVGGIGLHRRVAPGGVEIGYWIHVDHVRQGLATEAVTSATDALFEVPDVERVEICHDKANTAGSGVPRRLGFTLMEEASTTIHAPGQVGIEWRWVVTRTDWRLGRPS